MCSVNLCEEMENLEIYHVLSGSSGALLSLTMDLLVDDYKLYLSSTGYTSGTSSCYLC